jgi:LysM repeat protein
MIKFPKLISTLLAAMLLLSSVFGQDKERIAAYVSQYGELAVQEMLRTGVPAAITLAQGIHETDGGQSDLASVGNNHFGIKCKGDWQGETMSHDDDAKGECFRKYSSVEDSYKDHSDFLKYRPNYAFLFKLDPTDYEGWAKGLKKAGYATNPIYSQKLIKIIVENNLQQYTLLALQRQQGIEGSLFTMAHAPLQNQSTSTISSSNNNVERSVAKTEPVKQKAFVKNNYPVNKVFNINEARVILLPAGSSLLAVANNYNVSYKKLLNFNELDETDILSDDQLIFLEKKPKKGSKDYHVTEDNENVYLISQKEGVQLASILEYNHLEKGMKPAPGEKIYLKAPAPAMPRLASVNTGSKSVTMNP